MSKPPAVVWTDELRSRSDELLDEYRNALYTSLEGLTEEQTRRQLVPSKTTLLGLLKHVTYVEGVESSGEHGDAEAGRHCRWSG